MRGSPMDDDRIKPDKKSSSSKSKLPTLEKVALNGAENANMQWFVLKVQSNRERSIKDAIVRRVRMEAMEEFFGQIYIPVEKVVETKGGGRRVREQKLLPGYMMIQMELNDETWHLVRSTGGVGDFTGAAGKPLAMELTEIKRWLGIDDAPKVGEPEKPAKAVVKFDVAVEDHVKVKEGPFESFEGSIESVDDATGKVKIIIEIFGRPTEVELEHWQVEKV
jgi:transcriptional antiterminator NusG